MISRGSWSGRAVAAALMLTGLGPIPLITSVVVSILVTQRIREAREEELRDLNQILERGWTGSTAGSRGSESR